MIQSVFRFLRYYARATTHYRVHSPFVFQWIEEILEDARQYAIFAEVEALRKELLRDTTSIMVTDFGAGSRSAGKGNERQVKSIARAALSSEAEGKGLFRLVHFQKPLTMLELGTSLGVSSLYQAAASPDGTLHTLEGCPQTAAIAQRNFDRLNARNIRLTVGNFEETLPHVLGQIDRLDYAFFDGNHRLEPTLRYFELCLPKAHAESVFVFDDIHWSEEMEQAWAAIQRHPQVRLTIDVYQMGIVYFRPEQREQEHFTLIPARYKFWQL